MQVVSSVNPNLKLTKRRAPPADKGKDVELVNRVALVPLLRVLRVLHLRRTAGGLPSKAVPPTTPFAGIIAILEHLNRTNPFPHARDVAALSLTHSRSNIRIMFNFLLHPLPEFHSPRRGKFVAEYVVAELVHAQAALLVGTRLPMRKGGLVSEPIKDIAGKLLRSHFHGSIGCDGVLSICYRQQGGKDSYNCEKMALQRLSEGSSDAADEAELCEGG